MPTVISVRKENSSTGFHQHIAEVCTTNYQRFTRAQVVAGIDRGEDWQTYGGGVYAKIEKITFCPAFGCTLSPYIKTVADGFAPNNLDNLPAC